jgi:HEAT repeat protein
MIIGSESQAYHLLDDVHGPATVREASVRYLAHHPTPRAIQRLALALDDDDFGVHWEATAALTELGAAALPELLRTLANPRLAASPRVREGAYHVLDYNGAPEVHNYAARLKEALKGPAADISTLVEANRWLEEIESQERRAGRRN